jgi:D-alanine--poly(phosphoribitol) ligase subunit 1
LSSLNPAAAFHRTPADRLAFVIDGGEHTYGEVASKARRIAGWLAAGVGEVPARVGVLCGRTLTAYAAILGCSWAGHAYVPLSPSLPTHRLALLLARGRLGALIVDAQGAAALTGEVRAQVPAQLLVGVPAQGPELAAPREMRASDVAYVIFTSGTTGVPKGVLMTAGNLASYAATLRQLYSLGPSDRLSQCADLIWDLSVFDLYAAWGAGASLHVVPEGQRLSPARFIEEQRLTVWCSAPSVVAAMNELRALKPGAFPTVRVSMFCGEPLTAKTALAWCKAAPGSVVDNHYGPTEATCSALFQRVEDPPRLTQERGIVAIGRPFATMRAAAVDDQGNEVPPGAQGELVLAGPQVAAGYLGEPELTAKRFVTLRGERWYFTGDLARMDADGTFHHLGRADNQVKIFGRRIELEEVEQHLRDACKVDAVAAMAWPRRDGLPVGLVGFVAREGLDALATREEMLKTVPSYLVPRRIVVLPRLPSMPNGKVDRAALLALLDKAL